MLNFTVNMESCTKCGACAADCPSRIISLKSGSPSISVENEVRCLRCQHCFAVCPKEAISILGKNPEASLPLPGALPDPMHVETMMKGRRAVRQYREGNLEPELLQKLFEVACYAPSGRNCRKVRFTVVDDGAKLARLREEMMAELVPMARAGKFAGPLAFLADFISQWEKERLDFLFCGAPHLLITSAPRDVVSQEDTVIALSSFEMYARSHGVGTLWNGFGKLVINDLLPEFRGRLGIPEDHVIGYTMAFGWPAVTYARTTQHGPPSVYWVGAEA
jgi:nitroreductase/Pyruvate/2-oxoacid:ferredoxin oxidoreductase delta subunit